MPRDPFDPIEVALEAADLASGVLEGDGGMERVAGDKTRDVVQDPFGGVEIRDGDRKDYGDYGSREGDAEYGTMGCRSPGSDVNSRTLRSMETRTDPPLVVVPAAGRVMLERLRQLARARRDFAFETTLSGRSHARWLMTLRRSGYRSHLIFLALPNPEMAIARVADRVRRGGHDVPAEVVRRRFAGGLANLFRDYAPLVDSWQLYDNADVTGPRLIASRAFASSVSVQLADAWQELEEYR